VKPEGHGRCLEAAAIDEGNVCARHALKQIGGSFRVDPLCDAFHLRTLMPRISAACHHVIAFAIALKFTLVPSLRR
jgi:hypothetical protein